MTKIRRADAARRDVRRIAAYIAEKSGNRDTAVRFIARFDERLRLYAEEPEWGEPCSSFGLDVRRFVLGNFVAYYRPIKNGIELLRLLRGSRDERTAWDE